MGVTAAVGVSRGSRERSRRDHGAAGQRLAAWLGGAGEAAGRGEAASAAAERGGCGERQQGTEWCGATRRVLARRGRARPRGHGPRAQSGQGAAGAGRRQARAEASGAHAGAAASSGGRGCRRRGSPGRRRLGDAGVCGLGHA
nr:spidroin-1-like [Aegilops tauschii subsp. strangulata]